MKKIIAALVFAVFLCGCKSNTELPAEKISEITISVSTPESSDENSSSAESSSSESSESSSTESSSTTESSSSEESSSSTPDFTNPWGLTSLGTVWQYPLGENLSYDFASADVIKGLEARYGMTGEDLGYEGEWCAIVLSQLISEAGYDIYYQYNPCDLTIELLDDGFAHFYCLRQENYDSLIQWGLQNTDRVINTTREEFVPKRGDFICYLWTEEAEEYNWSHIGMVAEAYDGTVLRNIEGNIGKGRDPLYHAVEARERPYDSTVIGFIRLDERT